MEKMWNSRDMGEAGRAAEDFNASLRFDCRMWRQDIEGSIAHAGMLGKTGIITEPEAELIAGGLRRLKAGLETGEIEIDPSAEDIHTFVEMWLTAHIGEAGKKLHTARSRNDQAALDLRMYIAGEGGNIISAVKGLIAVLLLRAKEEAGTVMPGYTHMQRAQPVTFGQHMMAYAEMFFRDIGRLADAGRRTLSSPLGAGALAGTTHGIDRDMVAESLGFNGVARNSMDAVSDRDFAAETVFALSMVMMHLSRLSEELVLWCSGEFQFIRMDDAFSTGSSIMPQKRNPDIAELVRGKTGRVYGSLVAMLTMLKGLPLTYNKDMQEDKEAVFDALDTVSACLRMTAEMMGSVKINRGRMSRAAAEGFLNATDIADYLAKKGVPFRDAYRIAGGMVKYAGERGKTLEELSIDEMREFSDKFDADVYTEISLGACVGNRRSKGGTSPESVISQIAEAERRLADEA